MDVVDLSRYAGGLLLTLALMFALLLVARRFMRFAGAPGRPAPADRLAIVETLMLDPKRRLAVVRWGEDEHLLFVGHPGEARRIASRPAKASFADALAVERSAASDGALEFADKRDLASRLEGILARTPRFGTSEPRSALSAVDVDLLLNATGKQTKS